MGARQRSRVDNLFGLSFLDVLANTIGGLAFLLILAGLAMKAGDPRPPTILTESLPAGFDGVEYKVWLSAKQGTGSYRWSLDGGELPAGLSIDANSGLISGVPRLATGEDQRRFEFNVKCESPREASGGGKNWDQRSLAVQLYPASKRPSDLEPPLRIRTLPALPDAIAGQPYPLVLASEGGRAPYRWEAANGMPPGMQLGPDGMIRGKPKDSGDFTFDVAVAAANGARATARLSLAVKAPFEPRPLVIKTRVLPEARAGQRYALAIAVEGGIPPYSWSLAKELDGSGLHLLPENGLIDGTPTRAGSLPVQLEVRDSRGTKASASWALRVRPPITPVQIVTRAVPFGRAGAPFDVALSAIGGHPPYRWRIVEGSLPAGIVLDAQAGRITGTPLAAGDSRVRIAASDAEDLEAADRPSIEFSVLTPEGNRSLSIATRALPAMLAGHPSDLTLAAEGGSAPYQWSASRLADGLRIDGARIVGTPSEPGIAWVNLTVRDGYQQTASARLQLAVLQLVPAWMFQLACVLLLLALVGLALLLRRLGPRAPLKVLTESLPNARASFPYAVQLACIGGAPGYTWRLKEGELPPGMSLSAQGLLSGTPYRDTPVSHTLEHKFTVEVRDAAGARAEQAL